MHRYGVQRRARNKHRDFRLIGRAAAALDPVSWDRCVCPDACFFCAEVGALD